MGEKEQSATPIVGEKLTQEQIFQLGNWTYQEIKQTIGRLVLGLQPYGCHYDLVLDSIALVLGELISVAVDGTKTNRADLEVQVIERILDQSRQMKTILDNKQGRPGIEESMRSLIREVVDDLKTKDQGNKT